VTDNPMVADHASSGFVVNFDNAAAALDGLQGFSPLANSVTNLANGDLGGAGIELASAGLDALGYVSNPMKGLAAGGIAWLIDHVGPLNRFLSALAGDPAAVADQAQTWTNIAEHLKTRVDELRASVAKLPVDAEAKRTYEVAVEAFAREVENTAVHAYNAAQRTHLAGTLVATTRTLIRDWIAEWVTDRVWKWAAMAGLTPVTFGAAQAAFITDSVVSGARLAGRATDQLRVLTRNLDDLAAAAGKSGGELRQAARALDDVASGKGLVSTAAKRIADLPGTTNASRAAGVSDLSARMDDLASSAKKHFDDTLKSDPDLTAAAAARAKSDHGMSRRTSKGMKTGKDPVRETVKKQHSTAKANAAAKAAEAFPSVSKAARDLADEVDALRRGIAADKIVDAGTHGVTRAVKEEVVQVSNQDQRQAKAAEGQEAPAPRPWDGKMEMPKTEDPPPPETGGPAPGGVGTPPPDPNAGPPATQEAPEQEQPPPSEPTVTTTGPAPQPVRQETWQVRGTLDP
jgi:hypothetical protein